MLQRNKQFYLEKECFEIDRRRSIFTEEKELE